MKNRSFKIIRHCDKLIPSERKKIKCPKIHLWCLFSWFNKNRFFIMRTIGFPLRVFIRRVCVVVRTSSLVTPSHSHYLFAKLLFSHDLSWIWHPDQNSVPLDEAVTIAFALIHSSKPWERSSSFDGIVIFVLYKQLCRRFLKLNNHT